MGFVSGNHILLFVIFLVIVLVIFGPGKLPDVGAGMGKAIREFRRASTEVKDAVMTPQSEPSPPAPAAPVSAPITPPPNSVAPTPPPTAVGPSPAARPDGARSTVHADRGA